MAWLIATTACVADEYQRKYDEIIASRGTVGEGERLRALFAVDWDYAMAASPENATYVGHRAHQTRWTDYSPEAIAERKRFARRPLDVVATIDPARLESEDRVNYHLFKRLAEEAWAATRFPTEWLQVTQLDGVQHEPAQVFAAMKATTAAELENVVARLRALPTLVAQATALLEQGLKHGVTPPQITLRDVPEQVAALVPEDPFASALLVSFENLPATISGEERLRLRAEAARVYTEEVRPAYLKLRGFLEETYLPGARVSTAAEDLPDGAAWYRHEIKAVTSLELTPREIHQIGLGEVKRIRAEMERVKEQAGFEGSLTEFFRFVRTDPTFYFTTKEDLLREYRDIAKRADPQLIKLFKTLPRTPYGVLPVPAYAEKSQTTAYYYPGAPEAGRPGYFFANTYALDTRPKWEMEALTLHEAVPGHHLQLSLAQELENVPEFRKWSGYTAFVEGWGLYAESLGEEMGFYADPYSKFGQLTYEMWRAVRLVVDTGMHALGWSRDDAIRYFLENAGKSEHDIVVEIDRYLVWPGQALAYKLGELKIKELRAGAEKELGAKFDVRLFHDEVLKNGAVPLGFLEEHIRAWVEERKEE
jgi:uncharacterized protein (DUF885 family)